MIEESDLKSIADVLNRHGEIAFAYLHGSSLEAFFSRDIDIAVYLQPEIMDRLGHGVCKDFDFSMPLEQEIENLLKKPIDVQILNSAPLPFRFRVVSQGKILVDRSPERREIFELLSRVEYFDFKPRREEYLKEALT
jgi:predicted nucleotidyltransferase